MKAKDGSPFNKTAPKIFGKDRKYTRRGYVWLNPSRIATVVVPCAGYTKQMPPPSLRAVQRFTHLSLCSDCSKCRALSYAPDEPWLF